MITATLITAGSGRRVDGWNDVRNCELPANSENCPNNNILLRAARNDDKTFGHRTVEKEKWKVFWRLGGSNTSWTSISMPFATWYSDRRLRQVSTAVYCVVRYGSCLQMCFSFSALSFVSPVESLKPSSHGLIDIQQLFKDSILWAVPKHRRTIEKRLKRKFGCINDFYKMLMPRTDLLACNHCGHYYQRRHLCRE